MFSIRILSLVVIFSVLLIFTLNAAKASGTAYSCYKYYKNKIEEKDEIAVECKEGLSKEEQCYRMKYWVEEKNHGKKNFQPKYIGGCRSELPDNGGPWDFPNACHPYKLSPIYSKLFMESWEKTIDSNNFEHLKSIINDHKEWLTDNHSTHDFKIEMCHCKNDKENPGQGCNKQLDTIGVSKSGVSTLVLTMAILILAIIGIWFFIKSCQVDKANSE